jgi:hypothetical protein
VLAQACSLLVLLGMCPDTAALKAGAGRQIWKSREKMLAPLLAALLAADMLYLLPY